ncbi:MAG: glycosyltransferase [Lautropia sp.]
MKFTVLTYGTEGDSRPLAFLCRALIDAGHSATLLADRATLGAARVLGVPAVALPGDIRGESSPDQAIAGVVRAGGLGATAKALARIANANAEGWLRAAVDDGRDSDAVLVGGLAAFVGLSAAEALRRPVIGLGMIPITPTREFPSPFLPPRRYPVWFNRVSQELVNQALWLAFRSRTNRVRRTVCGLSPRRRLWRDHPMLYGISPTLCPSPRDWPAQVAVCGQWVRPLGDWKPPAGLQAFLDAGEPPLYVGFGSMVGFDPVAMRESVIAAVGGRRTVFNPGWSGMDPGGLPSNFLAAGDTPHDWLFPRVSAAVHHGGSGTTHSASRAGIPSVVVPFAGDQFFWAERLVRAGLSPARLDGRRLDASNLAAAIAGTERADLRERAAAAGMRMRGEDGLAMAVERIERLAHASRGA